MHLGHALSGGDSMRMMSWVIQCCRGSNFLALYISLQVAFAHLLESRIKSSRAPVFPHDPCSSLDPLFCDHRTSSVASCISLRAIPPNSIDSSQVIIVRTSRAKLPCSGKGVRSPVVSASLKDSVLSPHRPALRLRGTDCFSSARCPEPDI